MNNINVVYTPWSNLKKTADMDVGQIGFHRQKDVSFCATEGGGILPLSGVSVFPNTLFFEGSASCLFSKEN